MSLIDKTANFVKLLNSMVKMINVDDKRTMEQVEHMKLRLQHIIDQTASSEMVALASLEKLSRADAQCEEPIYIRWQGEIRAIITLNMIKPEILPIKKNMDECICAPCQAPYFNEVNSIVHIETETDLFTVDNGIQYACIEVFDHTYRTYHGFICVIAVATPEGVLYIIDAIKFREALPRLRLFKCGVAKFFHCNECIRRLMLDIGHIGCALCFGDISTDVFIDWRIRPINPILTQYIFNSICKVIEKLNGGFSYERFIPAHSTEVQVITDEYGIDPHNPALTKLLKLREHLAARYNEGREYVISNPLLVRMIEAAPSTLEELEQLAPKMSNVLRTHAGDVLIALNKKSQHFSVDRLKIKYDHPDNEEASITVQAEPAERHRRFEYAAPSLPVEDSSEFVISSDT